MSKINSNIDELRKIINEDNFKLDEANEFLDAIEENADCLKNEITNLEEDNNSKDTEITELEEKVSELENYELSSEIECEIGKIEYEEPNNLLLQDLMENLGAAIQKNNPKKVSELLYSVS